MLRTEKPQFEEQYWVTVRAKESYWRGFWTGMIITGIAALLYIGVRYG